MNLKNCFRGLLLIGCTMGVGTALADGAGDWWKKRHSDYFKCAAEPGVWFDGTIVDAAVATEALSTLTTLVLAAELEGVLSSEGPFTVFAPTNDAFGAIPQPLVDLLISDPKGLLTGVLTYHVVAGKTDPRWTFKRTREVGTVNGQTVFFNRDGGPQVNQSNVSCTPVYTTNGVVFVIDSVLLPQFLQEADSAK